MADCGPSRASFLTSRTPDNLGIPLNAYDTVLNVLGNEVLASRNPANGKPEMLVLPQMFKMVRGAVF